jgi:hypothetical protein
MAAPELAGRLQLMLISAIHSIPENPPSRNHQNIYPCFNWTVIYT